MAKILLVLYDDPVDGFPSGYPRDDLLKIDRYPDGQTLPSQAQFSLVPARPRVQTLI